MTARTGPPPGGTLFAEAQRILRRQGGPVMEQAAELLERLAADTAPDAELVRRKAHLSLDGEGAAQDIADLAADVVAATPDDQPITRLAAKAHAASTGSIEAFMAAQRARVGRHPGVRGSGGGAGEEQGCTVTNRDRIRGDADAAGTFDLADRELRAGDVFCWPCGTGVRHWRITEILDSRVDDVVQRVRAVPVTEAKTS